uniref:Uncharacterized protein n=1 Tax=Picea glauca TaxID=3330 RepID=A0A101LYA1_PICGL|nr:hypothetical protein ABT39_MTgene5746 [Picea glauca]QHR87671.1 hypothetical protein Q903MT_gene1683 [Picea sitchensis]
MAGLSALNKIMSGKRLPLCYTHFRMIYQLSSPLFLYNIALLLFKGCWTMLDQGSTYTPMSQTVTL